MKKRIRIIIGIIFIIVFTAVTSVCIFSGILVFEGSMQLVNNENTTIEKAVKSLKREGFDIGKFKGKYDIEKINIESTLDNHNIPADYILSDGNKKSNTIIMVHGLGGNRINIYPYAEMFLEKGYNVLAYDQRSSGENIAKYTTCGYLESSDLKYCVNYIAKSIGEDKNIGVWGVSFGGATVGIYLGKEESSSKIDFAIVDSPVSNFKYMASTTIKEIGINVPIDFLVSMGDIITKIKLGFSYEDMNVCNYVNKSNTPLMVINSKNDKLTPYFMGKDIYKASISKKKKMFTVKKSEHANIFFDYRKRYEEEVFSFINEI